MQSGFQNVVRIGPNIDRQDREPVFHGDDAGPLFKVGKIARLFVAGAFREKKDRVPFADTGFDIFEKPAHLLGFPVEENASRIPGKNAEEEGVVKLFFRNPEAEDIRLFERHLDDQRVDDTAVVCDEQEAPLFGQFLFPLDHDIDVQCSEKLLGIFKP